MKVALKRRVENPDHTGQEEFNYFLSVLFPDEELKILDYNRLVKIPEGMDEKEILDRIGAYFEIAPDNVAYDECIIFCPDDIARYSPGEMWRVEVDGLKCKNGRPGKFSYIVSFTK